MRGQGDFVESDLRRFYQVDLLDLWRGQLTLRQVAVFVKGLPAESATKQWLAAEASNRPPVVDVDSDELVRPSDLQTFLGGVS